MKESWEIKMRVGERISVLYERIEKAYEIDEYRLITVIWAQIDELERIDFE